LKYEYSYEPIFEETVVEVIFKNGKYEVTEANFGKGATGIFNFGNYMDKSVVKFNDTKFWQQDIDVFNKHLILNGNYQYEVKDDNLILTKMAPYERIAFGSYQYKLKRVGN
jgi:hypothetical protein